MHVFYYYSIMLISHAIAIVDNNFTISKYITYMSQTGLKLCHSSEMFSHMSHIFLKHGKNLTGCFSVTLKLVCHNKHVFKVHNFFVEHINRANHKWYNHSMHIAHFLHLN